MLIAWNNLIWNKRKNIAFPDVISGHGRHFKEV